MTNQPFKLAEPATTIMLNQVEGGLEAWEHSGRTDRATFNLLIPIETIDFTKDGKTIAIKSIIAELVKRDAVDTPTDVFYESLTDHRNVGKAFYFQDFEIDKVEVHKFTNVDENYLLFPRDSYHNIIPFKTKAGANIITTWTRHSDDDIKNIEPYQLNRWIQEYNIAWKNHHVIVNFENLVDTQINSTGVYYELSTDYNNYFNNHLNNDAKRGTSGGGTFTTVDIPGHGAGEVDAARNKLETFSKQLDEAIKAKEAEIKRIHKEIIQPWLKAGNLTDSDYNKVVERWEKKLDNLNSIPQILEFNELEQKVNDASNAEYYKHKDIFNEEASREEDGGISANGDISELIRPLLIEIEEHKFFDYGFADEKIRLKTALKEARITVNQILARKKVVVDSIEGLAKGSGGNNKSECPQCHNKFETLPISRDGANYCSETCSEAAKQKPNGPDQNQGISQTQTTAIQAINNALNQDPKIVANDLDSDFRDFETQIKGFSKIEDINSFKDLVLANIGKKRTVKKGEEEARNRAEKLKNTQGAELLNNIKSSEELNGTEGYEKIKDDVNEAIDKAFQEDSEKVKDLVKEIVEAKMTKSKVNENELGEKEKELFTKIKNKEINDKDQLKEAKTTLVEFIGNKEVDKKIIKFEKEVEAALKSGQNKDSLKSKLRGFQDEDNIYIKKRKTDIQNLLKKLENSSSDITNNPSPGIPWKIILPIVLMVVVGIIGLVLVIRKRKKNKITL